MEHLIFSYQGSGGCLFFMPCKEPLNSITSSACVSCMSFFSHALSSSSPSPFATVTSNCTPLPREGCDLTGLPTCASVFCCLPLQDVAHCFRRHTTASYKHASSPAYNSYCTNSPCDHHAQTKDQRTNLAHDGLAQTLCNAPA